jgi:hypothetical protein
MPKSGTHTQTMNVTANSVNIGNAGPVGSGRLSSGATSAGGSGAPGSSGTSVYPSSRIGGGAYREMRDDPSRRFSQNIKDGYRMGFRSSGSTQRHTERFTKRQQIGRGAGYAAFGQPKDPYASPTIMGRDGKPQPNPQYNLAQSARFRAEQSLNGRSRDELHQIATGKGITGITKESTREEINRQILAKKGSVAEFKNDPRPVGIGTGVSNDLRRAANKTRSGIDRGVGVARGGMAYLNSGAYDSEKGEFRDVKAQRDALKNRRFGVKGDDGIRKGGTDSQGGLRKLSGRLNYARDMNRITRNDSKFGAGTKKFNNSMGGRAGVGIGLGMASQYAPEEMRGAMALGATVATINPMLGLGVAGIGGAMKAQGTMKGAISGAAGGAALGGMLGPQGAAIGAGIGLLVGGIMGAVNKGKAQLAAAKATVMESFGRLYMETTKSAGAAFQKNYEASQKGQSLAGKGATMLGVGAGYAKTQAGIRSSISGAIAGTGGSYMSGGRQEFEDPVAALEAYYKTAEGKKVSAEDQKTQKKKATGTLRTMLKETDPAVQKQLGEIDKQNTARIDALSRATGKSGAELEQMAKKLGIDLYNPTVKYNELLTKFTEGIIKTGAALNDALVDTFLTGANPFKETREAGEKSAALNQNVAGLGDVLRKKGTSKADKSKAIGASFEQMMPQLLAVNGGDATKAYLAYNEMFGQGEEGGVFAKGGALAGQGKTVLGDKDVIKSQGLLKEGMVGEAATQISARLSKKNMTVDQGALKAALASKSPKELAAILGDVSTFDEAMDPELAKRGVDTNRLRKGLKGETAADLTSGLESIIGPGVAITAEDPKKLDAIATAATDFSTSATGLETAINTFNTNMEGFFKAPLGEMPGWWEKGLVFDGKTLKPANDTSTPRAGGVGDTATSKLSQTMGRHAAMNGQLTGKRTVTSSLRDYALGSINSDHATGSAYDLTGQNLGQYAKLVHANGGFAEFHGSMANRHLHVVPGSGMGDTSTPSPVSTSSSSGGGTNNYYTFEINGNNAAPEVIANMVMAKIQEKERSDRQRR